MATNKQTLISPKIKFPSLPKLLDRKIYKTGQTRGADNDMIYQNRVLRNNTVLVNYEFWDRYSAPPSGEIGFEKGIIALISPDEYFSSKTITHEMTARGLTPGVNALVLYETRTQWNTNNPETLNWSAATQRKSPLNSEYAARIPANTSKDGNEIIRGFDTTKPKKLSQKALRWFRKRNRAQQNAQKWVPQRFFRGPKCCRIATRNRFEIVSNA